MEVDGWAHQNSAGDIQLAIGGHMLAFHCYLCGEDGCVKCSRFAIECHLFVCILPGMQMIMM